MPQRICSRKAPLLKAASPKRLSKKNVKLSLNGSGNSLHGLKLSAPSNIITKVELSAATEDKWKVPSKKMRNAEHGKIRGATQSQMYDDDDYGNSVGKLSSLFD